MGRFRGGLRCIKYLLLGFNLLFWVRPEPAGQLGGRGPQGGDRNRVGPWGKAGCSRGAQETKREGTDGGGKGREKLEPPEPVKRHGAVLPREEPSSSVASPGGWRQVRGPSGPLHPEGWGPGGRRFLQPARHTHPLRALPARGGGGGARLPGQGTGREIPTLRLPGVAPHPKSVRTHRLALVVCWENTDSSEN